VGDSFKREFSLGQVDTGTPYKGQSLADGGGTATQLDPKAAPVADISIGSGMSVPGAPPSSTTVTRPTFLSAFLQNLGPALGGAMQAPRGSGIGGGIAGGFKGISEEADKRRQEKVQQQQFDLQQQALQLKTQQEADIQRLHEEQMKNYASQIETRANPPAKSQMEQWVRDLDEATQKGDQAGIQTVKQKIQDFTAAKTPTKVPQKENELSLIRKANAGGADAAAASADLKTLQDRRLQIAKSRGGGQYANFFDPEIGRNVRLNNEDASAAQASGKILIPAGPVSATQILQTQRAQTAIPAAIAEVRKHIGAWDNKEDRAIFARIISETPTGSMDHATWLGTILNSKLTGKLSPEGQQAVIALRRLNESLGSLRVAAALPATSGSMATTAALAPGATSPNSKFAGQQLDSIMKLVEQETGVPFLGMNKKKNSGTPPAGANVISLDEFLKQ